MHLVRLPDGIHQEAHALGSRDEFRDRLGVRVRFDIEGRLDIEQATGRRVGPDGPRLFESRGHSHGDIIEFNFSCFARPSELRQHSERYRRGEVCQRRRSGIVTADGGAFIAVNGEFTEGSDFCLTLGGFSQDIKAEAKASVRAFHAERRFLITHGRFPKRKDQVLQWTGVAILARYGRT